MTGMASRNSCLRLLARSPGHLETRCRAQVAFSTKAVCRANHESACMQAGLWTGPGDAGAEAGANHQRLRRSR